MPAMIDPARCNRNWDQCFPARVCPESAIKQGADGLVFVASELCGDCPGPCLNFCDGYAILYDRDPESFKILQDRTLGELSDEEALQARQELKAARENRTVAGSAVTDVTPDTFQTEVLDSTIPVLIDFWAPWCGPCKLMAPVFESLASEYAGRVKFVKINTEEQPHLAAQFRISSIPTLIALHQRQVVDGAVGALSQPQLRQFVDRVLAATVETSQPNLDAN